MQGLGGGGGGGGEEGGGTQGRKRNTNGKVRMRQS